MRRQDKGGSEEVSNNKVSIIRHHVLGNVKKKKLIETDSFRGQGHNH